MEGVDYIDDRKVIAHWDRDAGFGNRNTQEYENSSGCSIRVKERGERKASLGKQFEKSSWSTLSGLKELRMFSINIGKPSTVFHLGMRKYMIRISL